METSATVIMSDAGSGTHGGASIRLSIQLDLESYDLISKIVSSLREMYNPMFTFRIMQIQSGYGVNIYIPNEVHNRTDMALELGMDVQILLSKHQLETYD